MNRRIHEEASSIFYGINRFVMIRPNKLDTLESLLEQQMFLVILT
jgi:hypothetical protein